MEWRTNFSSRLKELRKINNVSLDSLKDNIGITKAALSQFENRTSSPSIKTLISIADFFGVSTDYLLGRTDNPEVLEKK
ncbi:helix-turn-helix transcriptional regulator [Paenibacillus melissococcoides]|nr:helix-turn-helix transcriptional regulator [Paenibacillus melissococcoides]CAH8722059.1 helix-turn-helix transcriptional regulator [Paenibacillus melissococcoides]CAH8722083.1 helix-turn-helix transcriptional regulator [Paenibacillus melissococcoides]